MPRYVMRRRQDVIDEDLRPGEYRQLQRGRGWGDVAFAVWKCPKCETISLSGRRNHHVDLDGDVSPASACPGANCDFAQNIHFDGWIPEPVGSA